MFSLLTIVRLLLVPVAMLSGFIVYGISFAFFAEAIPIPTDNRSLVVGALMAQGFLAAAAVSLVFSYPLAALYRRTAVAVALAMSISVLIPRLLGFFEVSMSPYAIVVSCYEILAYVVLLIVGTRLANNHLSRSDIAAKKDARESARPLP